MCEVFATLAKIIINDAFIDRFDTKGDRVRESSIAVKVGKQNFNVEGVEEKRPSRGSLVEVVTGS
jgi:hypothetical protein